MWEGGEKWSDISDDIDKPLIKCKKIHQIVVMKQVMLE